MKKRISLIIAGVLAILAIFLVKVYLDQRERAISIQAQKRAQLERQNQVTVLLAKRDISPGTLIDPSMVKIAVAPAQQVPPQTASSYDQLIRKEVIAPIAKGEPIMLSKLMSTRRSVSSKAVSLARTTPPGKRAITIPVDQIASVGGMIKPGDYVDVLCSLDVPVKTPEGAKEKKKKKEVILPLFQNVLILAVGTELSAEEEEGRYALEGKDERERKRKTPPKMVTLALDPQEANIIAFVQEQGKIQMILRSPGDSQIQHLQPASWETIFKYFMPEEIATVEEEVSLPVASEKKPAGEVEVFRGSQREVIPIYK